MNLLFQMDGYKQYLISKDDDSISHRTFRRLISDDHENYQGLGIQNVSHDVSQYELLQQLQEDTNAEFDFPGTSSNTIRNELIEPIENRQCDNFIHFNEAADSDCSDNTTHIFTDDLEERDFRGSKNYTNIHDFIKSEDFVRKISTPVDVTVGELSLMLLKFSVGNSLSAAAITSLFQLINLMFVEIVLPDSKYFIDKLFNSEKDAEFYAVCENCSAYIGKFGEIQNVNQCNICNTDINLSSPSLSNFFITLDPSVQISDVLNIHENYYDYVVNRRYHRYGEIRDIYDGKCYRDFVQCLPSEDKNSYVTFIFNTDGAPKFKCSQFSIWPIYLMINEIDPQIPFVDLMNELSNIGIQCMIQGQPKSIKAYALQCCVDAVARAPMQGIKQYNGKYGCNWCLHPGIFAYGCIRYALLERAPKSRDKESTIEIMLHRISPNNPIYGIKFPSPLINLRHFDIIAGFDPEYMHCCLEGVGSQITENILSFLNETQLQLLDSNLQKMAVPDLISRLSRPLSVRNDWKAREWENFILYYSVPLFILINLDKQLFNYWLLFVESLYILLKEHIEIEELDRADKMLHEFVGRTEKIFGVAAMTYNIHQLLHISTSVFNWGPLWAHSAFPFESANHDLLKAIKCAKGVTQQIIRFIHVNHNILLLTNSVHKETSDIARMYCQILDSKIKNIAKITDITYLGKGEDVDDEDIMHRLQLSQECKTYSRMIKDGCLYTIARTRRYRTDNSIVQLKNGRFMKIIGFIVDFEKRLEIALCQEVRVEECSYGAMKKLVNINQETVVILTHDIRVICVKVTLHNTAYLCPVPNLLHY